MYALIIKMATLHQASRFDWSGKPFWGLVQQNGPWKTTKADVERASMKDRGTIGGGNGVGGRGHAGNANCTQVMTPYQIDATGAPPVPSAYAMKSVMMAPVDMKRQTKMGRVKKGLTLAARTPLQSGEKMGMSTRTENVEDGQRLGTAPAQVLPDLLAPSTVSDEEMAPAVSNLYGGVFDTEHHIEESYDRLGQELAMRLQEGDGITDSSSVSGFSELFPMLSKQPSTMTPHDRLMQLAASAGVYPKSSSSMSVDTPMAIQQYTGVPSYTPYQLTENFLESIADYERGESLARQNRMQQLSERPTGVTTGTGKKIGLDPTILQKTANERGLTDKKPPKPVNPIKIQPVKKKTVQSEPVKIKPVKKVTKKTGEVKYQPVTEKNTDALLKRLGFKIKKRFENMKKTNVQYLITKAAYDKYMNKK